ncbi:MAG TPA: M23 family metallopeptidase [Gemmatimonadaceae bacterium]|nr:M23 family metallopeptidase [Gemmatimonadaceae bacterium]
MPTLRFEFPYPVKPWLQTQAWGVLNPAYQQFGFSRHNGNDVALGADKLIRAPFPGTINYVATKDNGLWQPNGGGVFVSLLSKDEYHFDDGVIAYVMADFLHLEQPLVALGDEALLGTVLAIADNTGFSTGPHTHIQLRRVQKGTSDSPRFTRPGEDDGYVLVDHNDANNSFNPTPYFTNTYAVDITRKGATIRILDALKSFWPAKKVA